MLDDFLIRAAIAGVGAAILAAPLGCFVVWRRMAYSAKPSPIPACSGSRSASCSASTSRSA